uniref:L-Fucosyltransferase n=1 Tax=Trieres chinensis TaxID=1514140 RepID=A0A7S1YZ72_TRICV|mmetsp:Transcript_1384/g.2951  ORF Transcript_1384/g.2951 Transcript_1384/m.2951 type:complete len:324 (+) Transcript_1384:575-1546(+)
MFQYASALGMMLDNARTNLAKGRPLRLCHALHYEATHHFRLPDGYHGPFARECPEGVANAACGLNCTNAHWEEGFARYTPLDLDGVGANGEGYDARAGVFIGRHLQSYKYFQDYAPLVRSLFLVPHEEQIAREHLDTLLSPLWEGMTRNELFEYAVVGIHIRRDRFEEELYSEHPQRQFPPDEYFHRAMTSFENAQPDRKVMYVAVASDADRAWMENNNPLYFSHLTGENSVHTRLGRAGPVFDLALLSQCDAVISTLGSYGWWANWASANRGGTAVYYRDQFVMDHPNNEDGKFKAEDYWPRDWTGIGDEELGIGSKVKRSS